MRRAMGAGARKFGNSFARKTVVLRTIADVAETRCPLADPLAGTGLALPDGSL